MHTCIAHGVLLVPCGGDGIHATQIIVQSKVAISLRDSLPDISPGSEDSVDISSLDVYSSGDFAKEANVVAFLSSFHFLELSD